MRPVSAGGISASTQIFPAIWCHGPGVRAPTRHYLPRPTLISRSLKCPGQTATPWLAAGSVATWNISNKTLVVTGPSAIIADPGLSTGVIVTDSGSGQRLDITPAAGTIVHIASITLSGGATADVLGPVSNPVLLDVAAGTNNVSVDSSSQLDLGSNDMIIRQGALATDSGRHFPGHQQGQLDR